MKTFIDLSVHASMLADQERLGAYKRAINEVVCKGAVVADLGTGTGVLTAFACDAGARRVYAIERLPIIEVARKLIADHGWRDRVVFLERDFSQVDLPEKVDVTISEVLGSFGVGETSFAELFNFKERSLRQNGLIMPSRIRLYAAPFSDRNFFDRISFAATDQFGLDLSHAKELALNQTYGHRCRQGQFLGAPYRVKEIDFTTTGDANSDELDQHFELPVEKSGELHGLAGWFEADLSQHITLNNAPDGRTTSWLQHLFPISRPVSVISGDKIEVHLKLYYAGMAQFIWLWSTRVYRNEHGIVREIASFEQNSFQGQLFTRDLLRLSASDATFHLTPEGQLARFVLQHTDGKKTEEDLVRMWPKGKKVSRTDYEAKQVQRMIRRSWLLGDIARWEE